IMVLNKLMKLNYHHAQNIWFRHYAWEVRLAKITPNPFVQREEGPPPDMKLYYHPHCLFEMFFKARANTKVIEGVDDIEGWDDVKDEDKEPILKFIDELNELRANKESGGGARRTPKKKADDTAAPEKFTKLCEVIASVSKYTDKSSAVKMFISRDDYDGDMLTLVRLLLPGVDQRVYNIKEKQIIKHFASIYDLSAEELLDSYKNGGDVSKTIRDAIENNKLSRVDRWLNKLTELTKDDEQINHLKFAAKRLSPIEVQYLLRLVMKDLRINAGVKHILDGLHASAYEAFQSCRDLAEIVER
ncbi:DNA ligase, partial [Teladorsagia circumcincta]